MPSVIQPWVQDLAPMQQTVLLSSIRGPDGIQKYSAAEYILRWLRRCILISAFDNGDVNDSCDPLGDRFKNPNYLKETTEVSGTIVSLWIVDMEHHISNYLKEYGTYPEHFTKHFRAAVQILAYKYPDLKIRYWWREFYKTLVKDLHLNPETEEQMDARLGYIVDED